MGIGVAKSALQKIRAFFVDCDGTLTDGCYEYHDDGHVSKRFHTRDMYALSRLENLGFRVYIATGCQDQATKWRMAASHKEIIDTGERKLPVVESIMKRDGFRWDEVAFIGDAEVDMECFANAAFAACPADAIPEAITVSHYVSPLNGGRGAVHEIARKFCEEVGIDWYSQDPEEIGRISS